MASANYLDNNARMTGKQVDYSPSLANKTLINKESLNGSDDAPRDAFDGTDDWSIPESIRGQPFFAYLDHQEIPTMIDAFKKLDRTMREHKIGHLISRKRAHSFGGRLIDVGKVGVMSYKGRPIIIIAPGRYWNFSLTHDWQGRNLDLTEVNADINGLTFAQVGQSEAMVCMDPTNQVFVVRNGGFAAVGSNGSYKVIDVVDTLNLGDAYAVRETEPDQDGAKRILGYKKEVKHTIYVGSAQKQVTIATFFNVPANNTLVIQNGGHLRALGAGQHVITNPRCTFRGFFSLGERQTTFQTQPAYTLEGVAVKLHLNLRYRVVDAIELTKSYESPFQALKNPAQSAVNAVVSRLSYQQFMR